MQTVSKSWRTIEHFYKSHAKPVYRALGKPVSDSKLKNFERKLPAKLPRDFVQSLRIHNGVRGSYLGSVELQFINCWELLPLDAIQQEWKMMTDLQDECGFKGDNDSVGKRIKNDAHWRRGWVPFLHENGNKVFIDLDPGPKGKIGQVVEWSNSGSFPSQVWADSFGEWLEQLAAALERGVKIDDEDGGIHVKFGFKSQGRSKAKPKARASKTRARKRVPIRRFEFIGGKSAKFWQIRQTGSELTLGSGRLHRGGKEQIQSFPTPKAAAEHMQKLIDQKLAKGYVEVSKAYVITFN